MRRPSASSVLTVATLVSTAALLALSTNLAKVAADVGLSPAAYLGWSVLGAGLALLAIGAARGHLPPLRRDTVVYFAVAGLVSIAAPNLLFFTAVPEVGAGFVALAIAFPPLLTYVAALALGMERFATARAAGVALALGGAVVLAAAKVAAPGGAALYVAAALLGPVFLAAGNIYRTLRWPAGATPEELAPGMLLAAAVLLVPAAFLPGQSLAVPLDRPEPVLLIGVQAAAFALQYLLFFVLQRRGGPVLLSLLGSVAAVVGVPIAVFVLGEAPPEGLALGGVLIAAGVALVTAGGRLRLAAPGRVAAGPVR